MQLLMYSLKTEVQLVSLHIPENANEIQLPDQTRSGIAEPLQEGWALQKVGVEFLALASSTFFSILLKVMCSPSPSPSK